MVAFATDIAKDCPSCVLKPPQEEKDAPRFGAYGDLSPDAWSKAQAEGAKQPRMWKESVAGRGAIRLFSRGVLGTMFFALFSMGARNHLGTYAPIKNGARYGWNQIFETAAEKESAVGKVATTLTHGTARIYDDLFAPAIKGVVKAFGGDAEAAVLFRPTRMYGGGNTYQITGRSLGHEVVGVTYDFAGMSFGDAMGRDLADWFDPNVKHDVYDEKGHLDVGKLGATVGKNLWKYISYNAGEDWAVAVPYVYFMKGQRHVLNKLDPGFAYDSDRGLCGASFKLDNHGRVSGNYALTGAMDLQSRFTVYNIGTLMFREVYADVAYRLKQFQRSGYQFAALTHGYQENEGQQPLSSNPITAVGQLASQTVKWMLRDTIKGGLYMTPAVPFFWMSRTPQHKYRGTFIHPEHGVVSFHNAAKGNLEVLHAHEPRRTDARYGKYISETTPIFYIKSDPNKFVPVSALNTDHNIPMSQHPLFDPSHNSPGPDGTMNQRHFEAHQRNYGFFDSMLQPFGVVTDRVRKKAHKVTRVIGDVGEWMRPGVYPRGPEGRNFEDFHRLKTISDLYVNASMAYTPYFFMKSDVMAQYWDTGKMDYAIEGLVDGALHLKLGDVSRGVGEVWHSMWNQHFDDPKRELEARGRLCKDISASDGQALQRSRKECMDEAKDEISSVEKYKTSSEAMEFVDKLKAEKKHPVADILTSRAPKSDSFVERQHERKHAPDTGANLYTSA